MYLWTYFGDYPNVWQSLNVHWISVGFTEEDSIFNQKFRLRHCIRYR